MTATRALLARAAGINCRTWREGMSAGFI